MDRDDEEPEPLEPVGKDSSLYAVSQNGRRLVLIFIEDAKPKLSRIEFRWSDESESFHWQQDDPKKDCIMSWGPLPQALSLIFLDYIVADLNQTSGPVYFSNAGDLPRTLGIAISDKKDHKLHRLFASRPKNAKSIRQVKQPSFSQVSKIFGGGDFRDRNGERRILVHSNHLPAECIEVHWPAASPSRLTDPNAFSELARRIRANLGIPTGGVVPFELPATLDYPEPTPPQSTAATPKAPNSPPPITLSMPDSFLESVQDLAKGVKNWASREPSPPPPQTLALSPSVEKNLEKLAGAFMQVATLKSSKAEHKDSSPSEPDIEEPGEKTPDGSSAPSIPKKDAASSFVRKFQPQPLSPINPALFKIQNPTGRVWKDSRALINFGVDDSGNDLWTIKDACEGTLIFGAPGSGKTSGSGFTFAQSFLTAGFGGLVLAAKTDEAQRWQNLCARFGRAEDCVVVTPDGPHKFNILAYEAQRPGKRLGLTDDLISFFRILIAVISKRSNQSTKEDFWLNATNQLMRALFDAFLLAGESLTVDSLNRFISEAPKKPTQNWQDIPFFGSILIRADKGAIAPEDRRVYENCLEYWTSTYPGIADVTRSGIILGFTAMADALAGRGIFNLISSDTTLTPEMILSGKIVILDLPLKDCGQGGLLVQAAWKYLFQRAIERRADKGRYTARPVFLWEDEGHLFFSQHDIDFQPTARDCRAAHVIISQSLHNFYQLGHNPHAVQGVFATMNTQIFHANGDLETNKWASEKIGTELTTLVNVSVSSQPKRSSEPKHWFWDAFQDEERESNSSTSINQHREKVFQPEAFAQLKKGGDGTCEAVILWVSHQFNFNNGRPFCVKTFDQDSNRI